MKDWVTPPPPPLSLQSVDTTFNKISPSILLIIIILAIIFFISGLLHLVIRFLFRPTNSRDTDDTDNVTALQGQLQQLFHLHDSGVDQSYIDTLPVFLYKTILGLKNPFDCAVCLCEFEDDDKLRLLPKCSHAFHLECIDTWLLSHSTCPLCRGSLLPEFPYSNSSIGCSPVVHLLESGGESFRERDCVSSVIGEDEFGGSCNDFSEICDKEDVESARAVVEEKVVSVKLGKFRNVDTTTGEGSSSNGNVDARRCYSMGSFEYVLDETSSLQVSIKPQVRKQTIKKPSIPLTRGAMSECDCHSAREGFKEFHTLRSIEIHSGEKNENSSRHVSSFPRYENSINKDSFSFSKIWLRTKKTSIGNSSRHVSSFRFPKTESPDDFKAKEHSNSTSRRTISEMDVSRWESSAGEDTGNCSSLDSQPSMPSFARKTLLWLSGKQNKVVHSSFPNI